MALQFVQVRAIVAGDMLSVVKSMRENEQPDGAAVCGPAPSIIKIPPNAGADISNAGATRSLFMH